MTERTERPSGATSHAVVWGVSALLYVGLLRFVLRIVALDFEALAVDLYYQDFAPPWWMSYGRAAVLAGAAPLAIAGMARIGYRLGGRFVPLTDPIAGLGRRSRVLLALGLGLPYLTFALPFAAGLLVWLLAEAAWWVQWYQHQFTAMSRLMTNGLPYLLVAVLACGALGTAWVVRRPRSTADGRRSTLRLVSTAVAAPLIAVALLPLAGLGFLHGVPAVTAPGAGLFSTRCGECHVRTRALFFVKTPAEWRRTVTRMREFEGADLDEGETERVIGFLTGMRSFSDAWTYRTRCERCHQLGGMPGGLHAGREPRDPAEWPGIVEGFTRTSPYYYREDVRDQIVRHLEENASEPGATLGLDTETYAGFREVGGTCGICHSLSRSAELYRSVPIDEVESLVARMSARMATPLDEGEQIRAARRYQTLIADPVQFDRLYPHDRPVTEDPLLW